MTKTQRAFLRVLAGMVLSPVLVSAAVALLVFAICAIPVLIGMSVFNFLMTGEWVWIWEVQP